MKKCLSFVLCIVLLTANASFVLAQTDAGRNDSAAAKIKAAVVKRGTGENKRVTVKKLDGTKLKGYISRTDENSFTLVNSKTNENAVISYSEVTQVKKSLSGDTIALIVIGSAGAVAAIVLGSLLLKRCRNEGGC